MRNQRSGDGEISEATPDNLPVDAKAGAGAPNTIGMEPEVIGESAAAKRETETSDSAVHGKVRYFTRITSRRAK